MRLIVGISLILLGIGSLSCRMEGTPNKAPRPTDALEWVRTADGWQRPGALFSAPAHRPQLHPIVVAAGQGLASILALVAFSRDED